MNKKKDTNTVTKLSLKRKKRGDLFLIILESSRSILRNLLFNKRIKFRLPTKKRHL